MAPVLERVWSHIGHFYIITGGTLYFLLRESSPKVRYIDRQTENTCPLILVKSLLVG